MFRCTARVGTLDQTRRKACEGERARRTISRNCPSILYDQPLLLSSSVTAKTCSTARGIIPCVSAAYTAHRTPPSTSPSLVPRYITDVGEGTLTDPPSIVNDFPEPVCPYANTQTLYPSVQLWTSCEISSKTSACVERGSNTYEESKTQDGARR